MLKTLTYGTLLVLAAFFSKTWITQAHAEPSHQQEMRQKQCRYQWMDPGTWTAREERATSLCVLNRWSVPGGRSTFDSILSCESNWNRLAFNPAGPYVGLGQHALSAWPSRVRSYAPPLWKLPDRWQNSRTMITVTARMMHAIGADGVESQWSCA